jgi:DNA-binding MarR family transcriptional regulator
MEECGRVTGIHVYQRRAEDALVDVGLTHLQFAVLATAGMLALSSSEVIQRHIVKQSGIKEAQVSLMIKALRLKGMVLQETGKTDPRVRAIRLTECGTRALESAIPLIDAIQNEFWPTTTMQRETAKM